MVYFSKCWLHVHVFVLLSSLKPNMEVMAN